MGPSSRVKIEFELSQELKKLELIGFYVFGIKREVPRDIDNAKIKMSTIFIVPSKYPKIVRNEKLNSETIPALLSRRALQPNFKSIDEVLRPEIGQLINNFNGLRV